MGEKMNRIGKILVVILIALILFSVFPDFSCPPKVQGLLCEEIRSGNVGETTRILISVNIDLEDESNQELVVSDLESLGASDIGVYKFVDSVGADFPVSKLRKLSSFKYVDSIVDADANIFKTTSISSRSNPIVIGLAFCNVKKSVSVDVCCDASYTDKSCEDILSDVGGCGGPCPDGVNSS